jgi:hypothetical protein
MRLLGNCLIAGVGLSRNAQEGARLLRAALELIGLLFALTNFNQLQFSKI